MQCNFQVGQKVVCVKTGRDEPKGLRVIEAYIKPVVGKIYTVREVVVGEIKSTVCILLEEIPDQRVSFTFNGEINRGNILFEASGFRPIVERGTEKGMSILRNLLNKQNQPVREDA